MKIDEGIDNVETRQSVYDNGDEKLVSVNQLRSFSWNKKLFKIIDWILFAKVLIYVSNSENSLKVDFKNCV